MNIDNFLYEIIEDYKDAESIEEKDEIFNEFCKSIWNCKNRRKVFTKSIRFRVKNDLKDTDVGKVFNKWSKVEYKGYKALVKNGDWCSIIRQKINNLYTKYFDNNVILNNDYIALLKTPQNLYYDWIKGNDMNTEELISVINDSMNKATELRNIYAKHKMELSWNEYKCLIEQFLRKAFDNCKLVEEYEDKTKMISLYNLSSEDYFYVSYICRSLSGEMLKWQKKYYGVRDHQKYKRCKECGKMIEDTGNKKTYCKECAAQKKKESNKKSDKKYKNKRRENRKYE